MAKARMFDSRSPREKAAEDKVNEIFHKEYYRGCADHLYDNLCSDKITFRDLTDIEDVINVRIGRLKEAAEGNKNLIDTLKVENIASAELLVFTKDLHSAETRHLDTYQYMAARIAAIKLSKQEDLQVNVESVSNRINP